MNDSDPLISEKSLPYYFIFPCDFGNLKTFLTACFSVLLVEESLLIINQSHELDILIGIVLKAVELSNLDQTAVARTDLCHRLIIVDEICLTFQDIVRLCVMHMLMPAHTCARRKNHLRIHSSMSKKLLL